MPTPERTGEFKNGREMRQMRTRKKRGAGKILVDHRKELDYRKS